MKKAFLFAAVSLAVVFAIVLGKAGGDTPFPRQVVRVTAVKVESQTPKVELPKADDLKLDVTGEGIETVIVANKLPFSVEPNLRGLIDWFPSPHYPPKGVEFETGEAKLTITKAPKGELIIVVRVTTAKADKDGNIIFDRKYANVMVVVGESPTPVPPDPVDPLAKTLQSAYDAETDANKADLKAKLAALYRQGAEFAKKTEVATWGALFSAMSQAASTLGVSGKIPNVQKSIQSELSKHLPTERQRPLDASGRALASEQFTRIAAALAGVK